MTKVLRRLGAATILFALAGGALAGPALAAEPGTPPDVAAKIRAMGNQLTRDLIGGTNQLYAPLLDRQPTDGVTVTKDIAYGPAERNRLDLFRPTAAPAAPPPIVILVHGGGFVRGDKADMANVGYYLARHGIVGVPISYRFAPQAMWPSGGEDVAAAIKWLREHPADHGGDINRIFLLGHSAGCAHVATYTFFEKLQLANDGVVGSILVSCPTVDTANLDPEKDLVYYGKDAARLPEMSAVNAVEGRKLPLLIAVGEYDPPSIQKQNMVLVDALFARDKALPAMAVLPNHNHISIISHVNTGDEALGVPLIDFIRLQSAR